MPTTLPLWSSNGPPEFRAAPAPKSGGIAVLAQPDRFPAIAVLPQAGKTWNQAAFVPGLGLVSARSLHFDYVGSPVVQGVLAGGRRDVFRGQPDAVSVGVGLGEDLAPSGAS